LAVVGLLVEPAGIRDVLLQMDVACGILLAAHPGQVHWRLPAQAPRRCEEDAFAGRAPDRRADSDHVRPGLKDLGKLPPVLVGQEYSLLPLLKPDRAALLRPIDRTIFAHGLAATSDKR